MSNNFKCFVDFNNNRYDIEIQQDLQSISFNDIFVKIQRIVQLVSDLKITRDSHLFEIFNSHYNRYLKIISFECTVNSESLIRVSPKHQINTSQQINDNNTNSNTNINYNNKSQTNSKNESNSSAIQDSVTDDQELSQLKLNLNPESYKRYQIMLKVIKDISQNNCGLLSDYEWFYVIHNQMIENGYQNFEPRNWKNCFNHFLEIYIKTLEKLPHVSTACSVFPFFEHFNSLFLDTNKDYYEKVMRLREWFVTKNNLTIDSILVQTIQWQKINETERLKNRTQRYLEKRIDEIKGFNLMIQIIKDIQHKHKNKLLKKIEDFKQVSQIMVSNGYHDWNEQKCHNLLHTWTNFYINSYKKYEQNSNNRIISYIFQLLQIIHSIKLSDVFKNNKKSKELMKIKETIQIKTIGRKQNEKLEIVNQIRNTNEKVAQRKCKYKEKVEFPKNKDRAQNLTKVCHLRHKSDKSSTHVPNNTSTNVSKSVLKRSISEEEVVIIGEKSCSPKKPKTVWIL